MSCLRDLAQSMVDEKHNMFFFCIASNYMPKYMPIPTEKKGSK